MQKGKVAIATLFLAMTGVVAAQEYSILPVEGSEVISEDGRTMMIDVIDTEYQHGTFVISLEDESFDSIIGQRAVTGNVPLDLSTVEVAAVSGMPEVVEWNQQYGGGGGGGDGGGGHVFAQNGRGRPGGEQQVQWARLGTRIYKYCRAASAHAAAVIAATSAACATSGGSHSGGSVGFCGIGSKSGKCSVPIRQN